ncbi:tetratricopeptide repeat protein [Haloechinothrix salitolerans]|uniref:Tetratricopeptide repeat protein n=1 Tax=Haloechinothrix salitolerans TaxID=926830 RepID=A0ABW2C366_9PSEU
MRTTEPPDSPLAELRDRLTRYPADRYPVQHATAQFHLGGLLVEANRIDEARAALACASELFGPRRMPVEHAKALNALGAVHRLTGDLDRAEECFASAERRFAEANLPRERGAAAFNLGLVHRQRQDEATALDWFRLAAELFDEAPAEAAATAREIAASLLATGEPQAALDALRPASERAEKTGDVAARGAVANLRGLAHLALDVPEQAIEDFTLAIAANPRGVRPGEYAMAKANLALACERAEQPDHARLAAAQALGVPDAAEPVRAQATGVLDRVGHRPCALPEVLDTVAEDNWPPLLREELSRWADLSEPDRRAAAGAWIDGQLARPQTAMALAEAWLGGLLELPPDAMERLIRSTLAALASKEHADAFRRTVSSAMIHFHVPQWMRLRDTFASVAAEFDGASAWERWG